MTGEDQHQLSITGFGVGGYTYDGKTHDNSLAAGKVAVALFRELTDNLYVFGQLTTSISDAAAPGEEPSTEIEIDNLLVSYTPKGASSLNLTFGTLDAPLGFERDDEVLLLTPSTSFNFELARPSKLTGLFGTYALSRKADLTALVANGWDSPLDPNHGKTVGARLGVLPAERSSVGLSALYGQEGDAGETNDRLLLNADYAFEPGRDWIVGGRGELREGHRSPRRRRRREVGRRDAPGPPPGGPALGHRRAGRGHGRQGRLAHRGGADAHVLHHRADLLASASGGRASSPTSRTPRIGSRGSSSAARSGSTTPTCRSSRRRTG